MAQRTRRLLLAGGLAAVMAGLWLVASLPRRGVVHNHSSQTLWVVETDSGRAVAHRLAPGWSSPPSVDADGVRFERGISSRGEHERHRSWWKVRDISRATVEEHEAQLELRCWFCSQVQDYEFGPVRYDPQPGWGQPPAE